MSCDIDHRHSLDPALLWLWRRLATAAPIGPLAWEPQMLWMWPSREKSQKKKKQDSMQAQILCLAFMHPKSIQQKITY